jgi:tRNA A37 threonylcarbamoyladenosine dehydratase
MRCGNKPLHNENKYIPQYFKALIQHKVNMKQTIEREYISSTLNGTLLFYDETSVEKIRNTTFVTLGLGGVGAITAELLARWGARRPRLLKIDKYIHFESSNLCDFGDFWTG